MLKGYGFVIKCQEIGSGVSAARRSCTKFGPMGVTTDVADSTSVPKLARKKLQDDLGIMFESGPLKHNSQIVKCQILNHEP